MRRRPGRPCGRAGSATLPLTGERTTPGVPEENYWFRRHVAAYRVARRYARGTVLDAGSGEGYGTAMLARRAPAVGVELDPDAAAHAAGRYRSVRFLRGDLCRLPVAGGALDAVVALQVLEHLWCADAFLAAARRALRPDGVAVLSTPNRLTFPAGRNPAHVYEFRPSELEGLLRRHFRIVRLVGVAHGARLAVADRVLGRPVPHGLADAGYRNLPPWLRMLLSTVTSRDFRITARVDRCLDLIAICRIR